MGWPLHVILLHFFLLLAANTCLQFSSPVAFSSIDLTLPSFSFLTVFLLSFASHVIQLIYVYIHEFMFVAVAFVWIFYTVHAPTSTQYKQSNGKYANGASLLSHVSLWILLVWWAFTMKNRQEVRRQILLIQNDRYIWMQKMTCKQSTVRITWAALFIANC